MWLIDQLYKTVKLGLQDSDSCPISKLGPAHEFNGFGKLKCYCEFECHQLDSFDHKLELAVSNTFLLQLLVDPRAWLTPIEGNERKRKLKHFSPSETHSTSTYIRKMACQDADYRIKWVYKWVLIYLKIQRSVHRKVQSLLRKLTSLTGRVTGHIAMTLFL